MGFGSDGNGAIGVESSSVTALQPSVIRRMKKKKHLHTSHHEDGLFLSYVQSLENELFRYIAMLHSQLCWLLHVLSLC